MFERRPEQRRAYRHAAWRCAPGVCAALFVLIAFLPVHAQEPGLVAVTPQVTAEPPASPDPALPDPALSDSALDAAEVQGQSAAPPVAPSAATAVGARPRFVSFRSNFVNMREGPSTEHRVKWVYQREGLPVQVLAEYDVWRRVRDMDGEVGWVHVALLSGDRTAVVTGSGYANARTDEDPESSLIAEVEAGVVGRILACDALACRLDFAGTAGWIDRERLWGVYADEHL